MVFHDYELARLTDIENGTVASSTGAAGETAFRWTATRPSRRCGRCWTRSPAAPLLIEIKDPTIASGPDVGALPGRVVEALRLRRAGRGHVLHPHVIAAFHEVAPDGGGADHLRL